MAESWLILETSGRTARVGLAQGDAVVRAVDLDDTRRHARDLTATVDQVLRAEGLTPRELFGVMVGRGPGSYTGLRVGLMAAKALAYATGCRLIAVETFAAIAAQSPAELMQLWVIADALQEQVYNQRFERDVGGPWRPTAELRIDPVSAWLARVFPGERVSGPGVKVYANRFPAELVAVPEADCEPRIDGVFAAGRNLPPLTRPELFALEPLYLRGSSAEEKAKAEGR